MKKGILIFTFIFMILLCTNIQALDDSSNLPVDASNQCGDAEVTLWVDQNDFRIEGFNYRSGSGAAQTFNFSIWNEAKTALLWSEEVGLSSSGLKHYSVVSPINLSANTNYVYTLSGTVCLTSSTTAYNSSNNNMTIARTGARIMSVTVGGDIDAIAEFEQFEPVGAPVLEMDFFSQTPANNTNILVDTNFSFNINSTENTDCIVYLNESEIVSWNTAESGFFNFTINTTNLDEGYNNVTVICNDSTTLVSEEKFYFYDSVNPIINYVNWVQISDGLNVEFNQSMIDQNFNLNVSCFDNNLYYMNITFRTDSIVDYNNYVENINDTLYINNDSINIGDLSQEDMNITVECADAHTKKLIDNFNLVNIEGGISFDGIQFYTEDSQLNTFTTVKLDDRYTFDLNFNVPKKNIEIKVVSPYEIKYIEKYDSFITDKYWFDFKNLQGFTVSNLIKTGNNQYSISLEAPTAVSTINFESIGLINIVTYLAPFSVDIGDDTVNLSSPANVTYNYSYSPILVNFSYIPYYAPQSPDNCTLFIDGDYITFDDNPTKDVLNYFSANVTMPPPQTTQVYDWQVKCNHTHFHPPSTYETHVETSETFNFTLNNTGATTTTTTTTTTTVATTTTLTPTVGDTQEFQSTPQALFYMFLFGIWIVFYYFTFNLQGVRGQNVGFMNILQMLVAIVIGLKFGQFNWLVGYGVMVVGVGTFVGKVLYK